MKLKIPLHAEIYIPDTPHDFLLSDGSKINVGSVSDEGLYQIGMQWVENLIEMANAQRKPNEKAIA